MDRTHTAMQELLSKEFDRRKRLNKQYSQRSFANYLGITSGSLSKIIAGKQGVSRDRAKKILAKISLSSKEEEIILTHCDADWSRSQATRKIAAARVATLAAKSCLQISALNHFRDWRCFSILEALRLNKRPLKTIRSIARYFGLAEADVQASLMSSQALQLAADVNGVWQRTSATIDTPNDLPSTILNDCHRAVLQLASDALNLQPREREFQSLFLAFESSKTLEAKKMIRKFVEDFNSKFEHDKNTDDVFCLSINFFPQRAQNGDQLTHEN